MTRSRGRSGRGAADGGLQRLGPATSRTATFSAAGLGGERHVYLTPGRRGLGSEFLYLTA